MAAFWFRRDWAALRPWLAGVLVLALLIWVISWLLDIQQVTGRAEAEIEQAASGTAGPVDQATNTSMVRPVPLADLLPLGPEDAGFRVTLRGTVVGMPIGTGFWILTDEDEVLFVVTGDRAAPGEDRELTGTLHQIAAAEGVQRAQRAELREAAGWKVHHNLYLEADVMGAVKAPADSGGNGGAGVSGVGMGTPRRMAI